jgi:hypothetical protein
MASNPEALNFSKKYLEPEVTKELRDFFKNRFTIREATFKEDTQDKVDIILLNNGDTQFDFFNKYGPSEIGINVKTIELKNNKGKQSNFTLPTSEVESLNRCSFYVFCLPERFTETRFCKYECYFCSKEDVLKYHLPKYPEFYLVPFNIVKAIYKFKFNIDLTNKNK